LIYNVVCEPERVNDDRRDWSWDNCSFDRRWLDSFVNLFPKLSNVEVRLDTESWEREILLIQSSRFNTYY
jgi:hypothetical protein